MTTINIIKDEILDSKENMRHMIDNFIFQSVPVSSGPHAGLYLGISKDDFKRLQTGEQLDENNKAIMVSAKIRDTLEKDYTVDKNTGPLVKLQSEI